MATKMKVVGFGFSRVTVIAGTPVPLITTLSPYFKDRYTPDFAIHSLTANTGLIYLGDESVDTSWLPLRNGYSESFSHGKGGLASCYPDVGFDLSKLYIDGSQSGDILVVRFPRIMSTEI